MPLITESHDSLPYLDTPSEQYLASARALITASLPSKSTTSQPHPLLPPPPSSHRTPALDLEQTRLANSPSSHLKAISTTHYESPSTPSELRVSAFYLSKRAQNLELLERYGKNSWLVHNSVLEEELRAVEKELVETREEVLGVNRERKRFQVRGGDEMVGLERGWKEGVGRTVEVQLAVGALEGERRKVLRAGGGR
ncbi:hypothetical protein G7Y79_00003g012080 [Physcia stellaris]|nr:hypothetical protein G7Y79_00003g012080 [Physcia stellaris]